MASSSDKLIDSNIHVEANSTKSSYYLWGVVYLISSQAFVYGYSFAAINPCLALGSAADGGECFSHTSTCPPGSIYNDMELSTLQVSLANALLVIGGWLGAVTSNIPSDYFGRKKTVMINATLFAIGGTLTIVDSILLLYVGRTIIGIGLGIVSCVVPILLSEISPPCIRGSMTVMYQVIMSPHPNNDLFLIFSLL